MTRAASVYYLIYKPYLVLSQFSKPEEKGDSKKSLKDIVDIGTDVYPVGRLDYDSEGLLILTNDKLLNHRLLNPAFAHEREYWAQVEGIITDEALSTLRTGTEITVEGKMYRTRKAEAQKFETAPFVPNRMPPIRFRKNIPDSWLRLILTEGKNRQVRKMTASVGFPTLRLIRQRIAGLTIDGMSPGDLVQLDREKMYRHLFN
jgi:23S rRNA pseudouridine2457 synthase